MGILSKAWKGVKKVVKKAARGIKKMAKKIAYAVPGGKQGWDFSSKVGKKAMGVVGKVVNKIGPIGMIALSILAPYAAPLWASFGAAAAAAGGVWGTIGTAIYTGANWVGATLSSMTAGISNAVGELASGAVGKAGDSVVSGFADAFTGKAGALGVEAGKKAALDFSIKEAAGQTLLDQTVSKITGDVAGDASAQSLAETNASVEKNLVELNPKGTAQPMDLNASKAKEFNFSTDNLAKQGSEQFAPVASKEQAANIIKGTTGNAKAVSEGSSLVDKATKIGKALLSNGPEESTGVVLEPVGDVGGNRFGGNSFAGGGTAGSGGGFLSKSMLQAMQEQQQRMIRGFG